MLKRKMYDYLKRWRETKREECLLIKGARQVGKSYIVEEFGRREYDSLVKIDFIEQPEMREIFDGDLSAENVLKQITLVIPGATLVEGNTLIFLDEIQECPNARAALKYLARDSRYDVIASGSLLGIVCRDGQASVPVGYERQVEMYALDFEEYLWAKGYGEDAVAMLREHFERVEAVPKPVNDSMMMQLREYLAIGGMPEVVQTFVDNSNFSEAFDVQEKILASYLDDIARYGSSSERVKARACYLSLPRQLSKENTKFKYSVVEKGSSARKFNGSIDWLTAARMVLRCDSVRTPEFPLEAYVDDDKFRLYANDAGLLMAMYGFEMMRPVVNNELKGPMKGGLYENLVAGMLVKSGSRLRYWISSDVSSEIEFLLESDGSVVPVEVKASRGSTASLDRFLERDDVKVGYKLIDGNVGRVGKKVTLPMYMAMFL